MNTLKFTGEEIVKMSNGLVDSIKKLNEARRTAYSDGVPNVSISDGDAMDISVLLEEFKQFLDSTTFSPTSI